MTLYEIRYKDKISKQYGNYLAEFGSSRQAKSYFNKYLAQGIKNILGVKKIE